MKREAEFDLIRFIQEANRCEIRYLLIGRWAIAQHGAPVITADYDFWIHPRDRIIILDLLNRLFDAELPPPSQHKKPFVRAYVGPDQIDCFSQRRIFNREGQELIFDEIYSRSEEKCDPRGLFRVRIPCIDDLIALKKFDSPDPLTRQKNIEDIRYLLTLKKTKKRTRKGKH